MSDKEKKALPEGAVIQPGGKILYPLVYPIAYKKGETEVKIDNITIRRKNMSDLIAIKDINNGVDIMVETIIRLTGLEAHEVSQIDDLDAEAIQDIIESFTATGPKAGPKI